MKENKTLRVSLFSSGDPSRPMDGTRMGRWRDYVRTYVMTHPTEWVPPPSSKKRSNVFLHRYVVGPTLNHAVTHLL